jgi:hypothetical protein
MAFGAGFHPMDWNELHLSPNFLVQRRSGGSAGAIRSGWVLAFGSDKGICRNQPWRDLGAMPTSMRPGAHRPAVSSVYDTDPLGSQGSRTKRRRQQISEFRRQRRMPHARAPTLDLQKMPPRGSDWATVSATISASGGGRWQNWIVNPGRSVDVGILNQRNSKLLPGMLPQRTLETYFSPKDDTKYLIYLAPRAGFEPATNRLTAGCSTAELPGNSSCRARNAYNKAGPALKATKRRKSRCVRLGFAWAGLPSHSSRRFATAAFA